MVSESAIMGFLVWKMVGRCGRGRGCVIKGMAGQLSDRAVAVVSWQWGRGVCACGRFCMEAMGRRGKLHRPSVLLLFTLPTI